MLSVSLPLTLLPHLKKKFSAGLKHVVKEAIWKLALGTFKQFYILADVNPLAELRYISRKLSSVKSGLREWHSNGTNHWLISLDQSEEVKLKPVFLWHHLLPARAGGSCVGPCGLGVG